MHAKEARKLVEQSAVCDLKPVFQKIRVAAEFGSRSVNISLNELSADFVIDSLKREGYTVKREQGYDQRDNESWDYLIVSW
jgi:hypothetical protein